MSLYWIIDSHWMCMCRLCRHVLDFYCCFQTMMDTTYDSKLTPLKSYLEPLKADAFACSTCVQWQGKSDHPRQRYGMIMVVSCCFPCCFHIANGDFWLSQYQPPGHLWPVRILPADSHLIAQMCHDIEPHAPLTALRESFHAMRRDATTVAATAGLFGPRWSDDKRRLFGNRTVGGCWRQIAAGWIGL